MSTKAIRISILVLAGLLLCFLALTILTEKSDGAAELQNNLSLNVANGDISFFKDTHGGFLGDGDASAVFTASEENAVLIEQNWRADFSDEGVLHILFGESGVFTNYGYVLPKNGLFYFKDFSSAHSINFVFAVYDPADRTVYYCRFDT